MEKFYQKFTTLWPGLVNSGGRLQGYKFEKTYQRCNSFIEKILHLKNEDIAFYDFGCGIGKPTLEFAKKYTEINFTLVNSDKSHLNFIKKNNKLQNVTLLNKDYHNTGLDDNSADIIFFSESYSHSYDRKKLLKELSRILKPNGYVLIIDWFLRENYNKKQWDAFVDDISMYLESPQDTVKNFQKSGFQLIYKKINGEQYLEINDKKYAKNYLYYENSTLSDYGKMIPQIAKTDAHIALPAIFLFRLQK
jgi:ubiquinone/menaquinone biosynthesis C-methylase UbiE